MPFIELIGFVRGIDLSALEVKVLRSGAEAIGFIYPGKVLRTRCLGGRQKRAAEDGKTGGELDKLGGQGAFWTEEAWGCDVEILDARGENGRAKDVKVETSAQCAIDA